MSYNYLDTGRHNWTAPNVVVLSKYHVPNTIQNYKYSIISA